MQQDVLGLDVAVHHVVPVRGVEGVGDFERDAHRHIDRELRLPVEAVAEVLSLHDGHDEIEKPVGVSGVVEREDVRMIEPRRQPDLAQKAIAA